MKRLTVCVIEGCGQPVRSRGWCNAHYLRWQKGVLPGHPRLDRPLCAVAGCESVSVCQEWCSKHYQRWFRHGDPLVVLSSGREQDRPPTPHSQCRFVVTRQENERMAAAISRRILRHGRDHYDAVHAHLTSPMDWLQRDRAA